MNKFSVLAILILLFTTSENFAQQYASQNGHLLDANTRIGSFGWNTNIRLDPLVPRMNLLMTGNVRGGKSFQGLMPYRSVGELNTLSSLDMLSDFRRDSTGVRDLSVPNNYQGYTPYISQTRQVTRSFGNRIDNTYQISKELARPTRSPRQQMQDQYHLLRPITRLNSSLNVLQPSPTADPKFYSQAARQALWQDQDGLSRAPKFTTEPTALSEGLRRKEPLTGSAKYNQQVFELLEAQANDDALTSLALEQEELAQTFSDNQTAQEESATEDETPEIYIPTLATLAHANVTKKIAALNRQQHESYMKQGQSLMTQGQFYRAADAFGSAIFFAPQNAPALLEKSHALFAAGEFMSSAYYLNLAIELSQEVIVAPVDMATLLGGEEVLQNRLKDIDNWQERTGNPMLYFLQGYVQFKLNHPDQAKALLKKAQEIETDLLSIQRLLAALGEK